MQKIEQKPYTLVGKVQKFNKKKSKEPYRILREESVIFHARNNIVTLEGASLARDNI